MSGPAPVPFLAHEGAPALMVRNAPCRDCGRPWFLGPSILPSSPSIVCCRRGSRIFRTSIRVARWIARGHAAELAARMNRRPLPADTDGGEWFPVRDVRDDGEHYKCDGCHHHAAIECGGGAWAMMFLCALCAVAECERAERHATAPPDPLAESIRPRDGSPGYDHAAGYHD